MSSRHESSVLHAEPPPSAHRRPVLPTAVPESIPSERGSKHCDKYRYRSTNECPRHRASSPATPAQNSCTRRPDETAPADDPTEETARPQPTQSSATARERRDTESYSRAPGQEANVAPPRSVRT